MAKTLVRVKGSPEKPAHARYKYLVTWLEGGSRKKLYFNSRKDADARALKEETRLINLGRKHATPTDKEIRVIQDARELAAQLAEQGIDGFSLRAALDYYRDHLYSLRQSVTVAQAVAEIREDRERQGHSRKHLADLKYRLGKFESDHGAALVASLTTKDVSRWLAGIKQSPTSRNNFRRALSNLFTYCQGRGYCQTNPVAAVGKVKDTSGEIGILTVSEATRLVEACEMEKWRAILPAVAIGLFAGLRKEEIGRLDWSEIDLDRGLIEVKASKAKTAQRRLVEIAPNLKEILEPCRQIAGPVRQADKTYRLKLAGAREAAGIGEWPHNALRHSFASYHLAHHRSADKSALQLGHGSTGLLFSNYRELVTPDDAADFWQIGLPKKHGEVVQMADAVGQ